MGEIITILLFICSALTAALYRLVRQRETREQLTREWINFLHEDLELSRT